MYDGNHARSRYNQRQIDVILEEILPEQGLDDGDKYECSRSLTD